MEFNTTKKEVVRIHQKSLCFNGNHTSSECAAIVFFFRTDRAVWVFVFESSRPSAVARGATRWLPSRQLCLEGATKWLLLIFISVHNLFQLRFCMQLSAKILHYAVSGSFTQRYFCGTRTVCQTDNWANGQLAEHSVKMFLLRSNFYVNS